MKELTVEQKNYIDINYVYNGVSKGSPANDYIFWDNESGAYLPRFLRNRGNGSLKFPSIDLKKFLQKIRKNSRKNKSEQAIYSYLIKQLQNYKVYTQVPILIKDCKYWEDTYELFCRSNNPDLNSDVQDFKYRNYIVVDIYIPEANLIIQLDGGPWHKNQIGNDCAEKRYLEDIEKLNVIRIPDYDIKLKDNPDELNKLTDTIRGFIEEETNNPSGSMFGKDSYYYKEIIEKNGFLQSIFYDSTRKRLPTEKEIRKYLAKKITHTITPAYLERIIKDYNEIRINLGI